MFEWEEKEKENAKDWAKVYTGKNAMYQGIATYEDESILLTNETLKEYINDLKGKPVLILHKSGVCPENMNDDAVGYVTEAYYNSETGNFDCKFIIKDDEAKELIKQGYSVSTAYIPTEYGAGGSYINTPYDKEIKGLKFTHLALVPDPRYEEAKIYENSKKELNNGFITTDELDEDGKRKVIFIPGFISLAKNLKSWVKNQIDNFKEGAETIFDFDKMTRADISEQQRKFIKSKVEEIQNDFKIVPPIAAVNITTIGSGCLGVACGGAENKARTVSLSSQLFSGKMTQSQWDVSVKSGFHPKGTGDMIESVLVHELGHSITAGTKNKEFLNAINKIRNDYMKNIKPKDISNPDFVSNYARTNVDEFIAECFSQGMLAKKPSKYSSQVVDLINEHFGASKQMKLEFKNSKNEDDENIWVEDFGVGYPIDEESREILKKEIESKTTTEEKENCKMEKIEVEQGFLTSLFNLVGEKFNACKKNEADEEKTDKRKLIDEVGGILKGKVDEEVLKTVIGKIEKVAYTGSEASEKDNEADDDKKEEKTEDLKDVVENEEEKENSKHFEKMQELLNSREAQDDKIEVYTQAKGLERGKQIYG